MKCEICKTNTQIKIAKYYKHTLAGLENVFLQNIQVETCAKCEVEIPTLPKVLKLHQTIANGLISKPNYLIGNEARFLRKQLRVKAKDWARYLRKDAATISRAENNNRKINKDLDLLIRLLYVRLWEEKNGKMFSQKIIENALDIQREELAVVVDVNKIDEFRFEELKYIKGHKEIAIEDFTFVRSSFEEDILDEKLITFGEGFENYLKPSSVKSNNFYATNSELAPAS